MSHLEDLLLLHVREFELPEPVREYRFAHPARAWQLDFAWPDLRLAAEVEGGQWIQGRHQRGSGFDHDAQKYNALSVMGWTLLRFPTAWIKDGRAVRWIALAIRLRQGHHDADLQAEWNALLAKANSVPAQDPPPNRRPARSAKPASPAASGRTRRQKPV